VNATPRHTDLALGPLVAAVGAVLLIVSLFLDWYDTFTAFTIFEFLDLLLLMLALVAIAWLVAGLAALRVPISAGVALGAAVFALLVVVSQILNHPPGANGLDKELGIWLGLSGAALMVAGAVLGYAHISLAVETRQRAAPSRPAPPSAPPPAGREEPTERL
jgi:hypothetical protein